MREPTAIWERKDAELRISEVFEAARNDSPQSVRDENGLFEIIFKPRLKGPVGTLLSRGGPKDR